MLQPFKIDFYIYASSPEEAAQLSSQWKDFVNAKRMQGIAVRADKLAQAIKAFGDSPLLLNYLK